MKDSPTGGVGPFRNLVLASLPPFDLERIRPKLQPVELEARQILSRPHAPIPAVHFLESGIVSLVARLERGGAIEIGIIGREGMVGLPIAFGAETSPDEALVQVKCSALRMGAEDFRKELLRSPMLFSRLLRFGCAVHAQVAQTAACNGRHAIEQRLTRWLLMAHDRVDSDDLPLTQEMLATMLGVRRASITTAVGLLQRSGAIDIVRGHVVILDRRVLERMSCECYATVCQEYRRLQPDSAAVVEHDGVEAAGVLLRHPPALNR